MRAARLTGPGALRIEDVPKPVAGPAQVLVQVEAALIGPADLERCRAQAPGGRPIPFGHAFCGLAGGRRVVAVGAEGTCADWLVVPEDGPSGGLYEVPRGLAGEVAALAGPLAACLQAGAKADVRAGEQVVVRGPQAIGLMLCACAADAGARPVFDRAYEAGAELVHAFGGRLPTVGEQLEIMPTLAAPSGAAPAPTAATVRAALGFLASAAYPWPRLITHRILLETLPALCSDPPPELLFAAVVP